MSVDRNCVYNALVSALHPKGGSSGWQNFNAVCCPHNGGHRPDTKGRGGIKHDGSGIVGYHCFNCGYKARFTPGRTLSAGMRNVFLWAGLSITAVKKIEFDVWMLKESMIASGEEINTVPFISKPKMEFSERTLPPGAKSFKEWIFSENPPEDFLKALVYANSRLYGDVLNYELYWTPTAKNKELKVYDLNKRILIPFKWNSKIVGWTGRLIQSSSAAKYYSSEPHDYMFNTESIHEDDRYIFIVEGPLDALAIDGVGMLGDRCTASMAQWLNAQDKEIIVVPDRMNRGGSLVDTAIEQGWSVTFPEWGEDVKDACDAVHKFGKLYTVQTILDYATNDKIKINVNRNIKIR